MNKLPVRLPHLLHKQPSSAVKHWQGRKGNTSNRGKAGKIGSIQRQFVAGRAIAQDVLCLATTTVGVAEYVAVLRVEGMSYDLKSEEEQQRVNELYQVLLCALSFPVQVLWRFLPLHLEHYLAQFPASNFQEKASQETGEQEDLWTLLAGSHARFLEALSTRRTLLDRSIYLLVSVRSAPQHSARRFRRSRRRQMHEVDATHTMETQQMLLTSPKKAQQELALRVGELVRHLENLHLSTHRLTGVEELAPFYYACLTPRRAAAAPLDQAQLAAIEMKTEDALMLPLLPTQPTTHASRRLQGDQKEGKHGQGQQRSSSLADQVAPLRIQVTPDRLVVDGEFVRGLVVDALPRVVSPGWLRPLAELDEPLEVSFHLRPRNTAAMLAQLRRRQMEHHSSLLLAQRQGHSPDPQTEIAARDVSALIERLASGEERMLDLSLHLLVRGGTEHELEERTRRVLAVLHAMLLSARVARFEQAQMFRSLLPHVRCHPGSAILLDSRSASTLFPFLGTTLFHPSGILEGITQAGDPVVLDPWGPALANANRIILGPPGWGKSHYVKTSIIRRALKYGHEARQHQVGQWNPRSQLKWRGGSASLVAQEIVIDPEREYGRIAAAFAGQVIRLAPGSAHHLNPFDLPAVRSSWSQAAPPGLAEGGGFISPEEHGDRLADHVQKLHTLLEIMLSDHTPEGGGRLNSQEKGLLDRAFYETYRRAGITSDLATHRRPAPSMRHLYEVLASSICGRDETGLALRLHRYVHGSLAGLFAGPTNVVLENPLIIFDVHDLETELRPIGLFLVSNFVWTNSFQSRIPRTLIIDEAATLMQYESGARFLEDLVRRARKRHVGVYVLTQHPNIFRDSALPANCATQVLFHQDATSLDLVQTMFKLSSREVQVLRRLGIGEALLLANEQRVQMYCEASDLEHALSTTNPREIAGWYTPKGFIS